MNWNPLIKMVSSCYVLMALWTILIKADLLTFQTDNGLIIGLGFLFIFAFSIWFGKDGTSIKNLSIITLVTLATFLISSFVLSLLMLKITDQIWLYYAVNAVFVTFIFVWLLDKLYGIPTARATKLFSLGCILCAYYFIDADAEFLLFSLDLHPRETMFLLFQGFFIIPLAFGLSSRKIEMKNT